MKKYIIACLVLGTAALLSCKAVPNPPVENPWKEIELQAAATPVMAARAATFRAAVRTGSGCRSGAYVYYSRSVTDYRERPLLLAARLKLLGFTDIYLGGRPSDVSLAPWIKVFIEAASGYGMRVHAIMLSDPKLFVSDEPLYRDVGELKAYNAAVEPSMRYAGISADLEPHTMQAGRNNRPEGLLWEWDSANNYGVGNDNDLLMQRTVRVMELAKQELGGLSLSEATHYSFQQRRAAGDLSTGASADFLAYCDHLIVMCYNNNKERIWRSAEASVAAGNKDEGVSIAIKTTLNSQDESTSLQPQGWDYLMETIRYLVERGARHASFRGIDIFEYQGLEIMWSESLPDIN